VYKRVIFGIFVAFKCVHMHDIIVFMYVCYQFKAGHIKSV